MNKNPFPKELDKISPNLVQSLHLKKKKIIISKCPFGCNVNRQEQSNTSIMWNLIDFRASTAVSVNMPLTGRNSA